MDGQARQAGFSFLVTVLVHCIVLPLASTRCVEETLADIQRLAVNLQRRSNISPPRNVPVELRPPVYSTRLRRATVVPCWCLL